MRITKTSSEPMMRSHWFSRSSQSSMTRVPMPPIAFGAREDRAEHVAEAADHRVAEAVDRREDVELACR